MPIPQVSAGCLVTREGTHGVEVLLVHPRRATFRQPLFGIPKGLVEPGEDLETTALRETREETGLQVRVRAALGSVKQKSGKVVHAFWATVEPDSESAIDEQGRCRTPDDENDVRRFYPLDKARELMIPAQLEFLDRLTTQMMSSGPQR
jgi:predicted NUDIX family NTP pyrophosphohydrolase